jgi:hypothetical protein
MRRMYGHAIGDVESLKAKYDPRRVLRNAFFDRAFGELQ